jgi:hypothetical protein
MPHAGNLTYLPIEINSIDNPVRTKGDLAEALVFVLGNHASQLGKVLKTVSSEIN